MVLGVSQGWLSQQLDLSQGALGWASISGTCKAVWEADGSGVRGILVGSGGVNRLTVSRKRPFHSSEKLGKPGVFASLDD